MRPLNDKDNKAGDEEIVFGVGPDPDPQNVSVVLDRQGAVVKADANGPKRSDLLEV